LLREHAGAKIEGVVDRYPNPRRRVNVRMRFSDVPRVMGIDIEDRKSTRLNSSHVSISYAVFCLKKKKLDGSYQVAGVPQGKVQLCVIILDPAKVQERFSKLAVPTDRLATDDRSAPPHLVTHNWF